MTLQDLLQENWHDLVPTITLNKINDMNRSVPHWFNSRSRTLNNLLYSNLSTYNKTSPSVLIGLCGLYLNKPIGVYPIYDLITSEDAETITLNDIIHRVGHFTDNDKIHITIYHIAKGKSYLKPLLDKSTANRLMNIERFCIENVNHFVRIYKGFGNTNAEDITIFTDMPTQQLFNKILIFLPGILNILPDANEKAAALNKIFEELYNTYTQNINITVLNNAAVIDLIKTKIKEYADLFDFTTESISEFTVNLAKAKNDSATSYYKTKLSEITRRINDYENSLEGYYVDKANYEREIIANQAVSEIETQAFLDTIKTSKAIEIIDATATTLTLRITAPLQYFTESDFEAYENNAHSTYNGNYTNPALKSIMHKIFVTREYKLPIQSIITVSINNNSYYSQPLAFRAQTNILENFTAFPNPHLYHHDCWGAAKTEMQKNISANNFELVVLQMVAATQSVNVAESASFINGFLSDFINNNFEPYITIIDKNGVSRNLKDAIENEKQILKENALESAKEIITNAPKQAYTQVEIPDEEDENETD